MLQEILDTCTFCVLLRIDTDSLIIGSNVQQDIVNFFQARPQIGMAGAFQRRGDGTIKKDAMKQKGDEISREKSEDLSLKLT